MSRLDPLFAARPSFTSTAEPPGELSRFNRRQVLAGASALAVTGCGGEKSSAPTAAVQEAPLAAAAAAKVREPEMLPVSKFYKPEHGRNLQPAFQTAIDRVASGKYKIVNDLGPITGEMWCPERKWPVDQLDVAQGMYLTVRHSVHIDFKGATFDLKGPGGGSRDQPIAGAETPWRGAWLHTSPWVAYDRLAIENVVVDGGFRGSYQTLAERNLYDKGVWLGGTRIREVFMSNVELRNFAGEIYYAVGIGPDYQYVENCHFHGSAQCAWDPCTTGKVKAVNLRAGRAYQCAETLSGAESIYEGGLFYDSGVGGSVFYGGPAPTFDHANYHWTYPYWDGVVRKPVLHFNGTRFERVRWARFSAFVTGSLEVVDGDVRLDCNVGYLRDADLRVKVWSDRQNVAQGLLLGGPPTRTTQLPGSREGILITPPHDIRVDVECLQTDYAKNAGNMVQCGFRFLGGVIEPSVAVNVAGHARKAWEAIQHHGPSPVLPMVTTSGFYA